MKQKRDDMRKAYKRDLALVKPATKLEKWQLAELSADQQYNRLTEVMLPYCLQLVHNYQSLTASADYDFMDLIQEASIATMNAVKAWNPSKGALTTFIKFHVRGRFSRLSQTFAKQIISIDQLIEAADKRDPSALWQIQEILLDDSQGPEDVYRYLQLMGWLEKHSETLPDRQREAFRLFCGLDTGYPMKLSEIALEMGISSPAVKKLLDKGLRLPE